MGQQQRVEIDVDVFGHGTLMIGGVDVSQGTRSVTITSEANAPTQVDVVLQPRGGVRATLDALVKIGLDVTDGHAPGAAVAQWLRGLDPEALQSRALSREDLGDGPASGIRAVLATLADMAEERPSG